MKIIITADLHIHEWQEFATNESGHNSRMLAGVAIFRDLRKYAVKHNITNIIVAGDLFHKRGVIFTAAYNLVVDELAKLKKAGIKVWLLPGNHDQTDKSGTTDATEALVQAELAAGVKTERGWSIWDLGKRDELTVAAFSYNDRASELLERCDAANRILERSDAGGKIAIFHHGFQGARVGTSLEYEVKEPLKAKRLLGMQVDAIFSGHYHGHQAIKGHNNAWYIGSPMQNVRGEDRDKGFIVYDSSTATFERVRLERPEFVRCLEEEISSVADELRGNYVDVHHDPRSKGIERLKEELLSPAFGALGVKLVPIAKQKKAVKRIDIDLGTSQKEILKRYIKHTTGKHNKNLLNLGLDFLNKADQ